MWIPMASPFVSTLAATGFLRLDGRASPKGANGGTVELLMTTVPLSH
jgi:hypothetical protein